MKKSGGRKACADPALASTCSAASSLQAQFHGRANFSVEELMARSGIESRSCGVGNFPFSSMIRYADVQGGGLPRGRGLHRKTHRRSAGLGTCVAGASAISLFVPAGGYRSSVDAVFACENQRVVFWPRDLHKIRSSSGGWNPGTVSQSGFRIVGNCAQFRGCSDQMLFVSARHGSCTEKNSTSRLVVFAGMRLDIPRKINQS